MRRDSSEDAQYSRKFNSGYFLTIFNLLVLLVSPTLAQTSITPRPVKMLIISMFDPESKSWIDQLGLTQKIAVPGLSRDDSYVYCNDDGVCLMVTGMGHANAAASTMALIFSRQFDLTEAYVLIAGVAGIDPRMGTLGSAAWARYLVDFGIQNEIDAREKPADWSTGYAGIHAANPQTKPELAYKMEVFELNEALLKRILALTGRVQLADSPKAAAYRANYPDPPANRPPTVIQCDTLSADTWWHGALIGERAHDWVALLTDGKGAYCTTQQEDNATFDALLRGESAGLIDTRRVAVLRTASNFDRPYPGETAEQSLSAKSGGFPVAIQNLTVAAMPYVHEVVADWAQWKSGMPQ